MRDRAIRIPRIGALLIAAGFGWSIDARAIPACDSSQRHPVALAFKGTRPLAYPDSAYAAGIEGNVTYQYTVDDAGVVSMRCLVGGTGSDELDNAMLERFSHATAILPRDRSRHRPDTVYQDSAVASLVRESELREAVHESSGGAQAMSLELVRHGAQPVYPPEAMADNEEGDVSVIARFSEQGEALSVAIVKSSGYPLLDRAAMVAMLETQLKLRPAEIRVQRSFAFRLAGKSVAKPAASPASAASAN